MWKLDLCQFKHSVFNRKNNPLLMQALVILTQNITPSTNKMADTHWKWLNSTLYIHPELRRVLDTCLQPWQPANQSCGSLKKVTNMQLEQGQHMTVPACQCTLHRMSLGDPCVCRGGRGRCTRTQLLGPGAEELWKAKQCPLYLLNAKLFVSHRVRT